MNKKLECLRRVCSSFHDTEIVDWLVEQKFCTALAAQQASHLSERAEFILRTLNNSNLLLLDFEWSILPLEIIKITCISQSEKKEFIFYY